MPGLQIALVLFGEDVFGQSGIGYPVTRPGIGPVIAKRAIAHHLRPGLPSQLCMPFRLIKSPDKAVIPILFAVPEHLIDAPGAAGIAAPLKGGKNHQLFIHGMKNLQKEISCRTRDMNRSPAEFPEPWILFCNRNYFCFQAHIYRPASLIRCKTQAAMALVATRFCAAWAT